MKKYISDASDSGNRMTQFTETYENCNCEDGWVLCSGCGGDWQSFGRWGECEECTNGYVICPDCEGSGEVMVIK